MHYHPLQVHLYSPCHILLLHLRGQCDFKQPPRCTQHIDFVHPSTRQAMRPIQVTIRTAQQGRDSCGLEPGWDPGRETSTSHVARRRHAVCAPLPIGGDWRNHSPPPRGRVPAGSPPGTPCMIAESKGVWYLCGPATPLALRHHSAPLRKRSARRVQALRKLVWRERAPRAAVLPSAWGSTGDPPFILTETAGDEEGATLAVRPRPPSRIR